MGNCKVCGQPLKQIPAGVSKSTGKPYNAFTACPNRCQQPKVWDNRPTATPPAPTKEEPNWEDINFGKCKHQFLIEMFKHILEDEKSSPHTVDLKGIETDCEEWATMSMRKLPKTLTEPVASEPVMEEPPF